MSGPFRSPVWGPYLRILALGLLVAAVLAAFCVANLDEITRALRG